MLPYYNIVAINAGFFDPPQTLFVGSNPYGGNFVQGNNYSDIIYGASQGNLYSGTVGGNTIYGGGGSNTIYGDADGLYGTVTARPNAIWVDSPSASDSRAENTVYGSAYLMGGDSTAGTTNSFGYVTAGNAIHDSYGGISYLFGNAYEMTDHAWGGHNAIYAFSATSTVYGEAVQIDGSSTYDSVHGSGVLGGGNAIHFFSPNGTVYGDASNILGEFSGVHNTIELVGTQNATVYGTADSLDGSIVSGTNVITFAGSNTSHYTIYGDALENFGLVSSGGQNTIAGSGNATIFGDCKLNYGQFTGGFNTISAGSGNFTIYGDGASNAGTFEGGYNTITAGSGNYTIYGDCASNTGSFSGGHNTIYAGSGNATMYGSATDGFNTFVFAPGTAVDQIGSRNTDGSVLQGFDQEGGTALNHALGDVIDVSAYHLGGLQNLVIGADPHSGDAVVYLPQTSDTTHGGQITLAGVHPQDLMASDFHF
jgi:hypothetical protein